MSDAQALGLELQEGLPENSVPVDCFVICKYLNAEGKLNFLFTSTESLSDIEALGLIETAREWQKQNIMQNFGVGIEEDDDEDD